MRWNEFVTAYLTFSRREMIGISMLLLVTVLVFLAPSILNRPGLLPVSMMDTTWFSPVSVTQLADSTRNYTSTPMRGANKSGYTYPAALFYFDPNTLDFDGWKRLGLRDRTIQTIQRFLAKGGHFHNAEDLAKVYGLRHDEWERLRPYVQIKQALITFSKAEKINTAKVLRQVDINSADTTAFIALPGIGSKLAARIINFRDKLGGFYSIEQVGETYGLADSNFQKIKKYLTINNAVVKKININTATLDELKAHPYIKSSIANPVIAYRNNHGPFLKIEDIKKVVAVTDEVYGRVAPYLSVEE